MLSPTQIEKTIKSAPLVFVGIVNNRMYYIPLNQAIKKKQSNKDGKRIKFFIILKKLMTNK